MEENLNSTAAVPPWPDQIVQRDIVVLEKALGVTLLVLGRNRVGGATLVPQGKQREKLVVKDPIMNG